MTIQNTKVEGSVPLMEGGDAAPVDAQRIRGRDAEPKALALILAAVAAGAAVLVVALAGHASSLTCEDAIRNQVRATILGQSPSWAAKPDACAGVSDAEVDAIAGDIFGRAVGG